MKSCAGKNPAMHLVNKNGRHGGHSFALILTDSNCIIDIFVCVIFYSANPSTELIVYIYQLIFCLIIWYKIEHQPEDSEKLSLIKR